MLERYTVYVGDVRIDASGEFTMIIGGWWTSRKYSGFFVEQVAMSTKSRIYLGMGHGELVGFPVTLDTASSDAVGTQPPLDILLPSRKSNALTQVGRGMDVAPS